MQIQGVSGDNYPMIFHPVQQYTTFTAVPESVGCGLKF